MLMIYVNDIHRAFDRTKSLEVRVIFLDTSKAFDRTKSLEVRVIFLDTSKAFDRVWHGGLIFKMRQNGVSGRLLKLFQN